MSEHYNTLNEYAKYYGKDVTNLIKIYEQKIDQYVYRDLCLGKHPELFFTYKQGERALAVIETYLSQNAKGA